jgi:hypothetical protein
MRFKETLMAGSYSTDKIRNLVLLGHSGSGTVMNGISVHVILCGYNAGAGRYHYR